MLIFKSLSTRTKFLNYIEIVWRCPWYRYGFGYSAWFLYFFLLDLRRKLLNRSVLNSVTMCRLVPKEIIVSSR